VLADDHPALRRNLRMLLDIEPDLETVAEASDMRTALEQIRAYRPHVLVLGLRPADGSLAEPIDELRKQSPRTEIVVITMQDNKLLADQVLAAGAIGFVLTDRADVELTEAVRNAATGAKFVSPHVV